MNDDFDRPSVVSANAFDELAHHLRQIREVKRSAAGQIFRPTTDLRKVADIMKTLQLISRGTSSRNTDISTS